MLIRSIPRLKTFDKKTKTVNQDSLKNPNINLKTAAAFSPLILALAVLRGHKVNGVISSPLVNDFTLSLIGTLTGVVILISSERLTTSSRSLKKEHIISGVSTVVLVSVLSIKIPEHLLGQNFYLSMAVLTGLAASEILALKIFRPELLSWKFVLPTVAHLFDAVTTVIALQNGARELNIFIRFTNSIMGEYSIFAAKFLIVFPVTVYIIDSEFEYSNILLILISSMGISIGLSNLLVV